MSHGSAQKSVIRNEVLAQLDLTLLGSITTSPALAFLSAFCPALTSPHMSWSFRWRRKHLYGRPGRNLLVMLVEDPVDEGILGGLPDVKLGLISMIL
jgi:hypothetical protein